RVTRDIDSNKSRFCNSNGAGVYAQYIVEATYLLVRNAGRQYRYLIIRERENPYVRVSKDIRENDRHYSFSLTGKHDNFAFLVFDNADPNLPRWFAYSSIPEKTVCLFAYRDVIGFHSLSRVLSNVSHRSGCSFLSRSRPDTP